MKEFNALEIKKITLETNNATAFAEVRFPYQDSYERFNNDIVQAAKEGKNNVSFDFIDDSLIDGTLSFDNVRRDSNRIYHPRVSGGQNNLYDYPNYLNARGFNVEIREANSQHGYRSKSYFISW
ncbi:hypothetical protein [Fluviicola taffensis]|uniref:hypothetical protein n=1 Tax=Fluviicola taffensis TaxID=191579 RepID=UPI003137E2E8